MTPPLLGWVSLGIPWDAWFGQPVADRFVPRFAGWRSCAETMPLTFVEVFLNRIPLNRPSRGDESGTTMQKAIPKVKGG